jgi:ribosomal-protein-alanine N-acetyltransferase
MVLEVRASNLPAINLYRKAGFADIGLRREYYPAENGREDAILMGRGL